MANKLIIILLQIDSTFFVLNIHITWTYIFFGKLRRLLYILLLFCKGVGVHSFIVLSKYFPNHAFPLYTRSIVVQGHEDDFNRYGIASSNFDIYHEYTAGESFHIDILMWAWHSVRCETYVRVGTGVVCYADGLDNITSKPELARTYLRCLFFYTE